MKKLIVLVATVVLASTVASVAASGQDATHGAEAARVTILRNLYFELVGQFRNSALGVTPVTHIHYGYLSYVEGVSASTAAPEGKGSAQFTFFADGKTSPIVSNGPLIFATRVGTLTIYRDLSRNSDFARPATFRDGTPVLVAHYRHMPITSILTSAVSLLSRDTITSAKPFATAKGKIQLGKVGESFEEHYTGQGNMPGPPSGYFIGYAVSR